MTRSNRTNFGLAVILALLGTGGQVHAVNILVNSGFESGGGSFAGWTIVDQAAGSGKWYIQTGVTSPTSGLTVPAPPGPTHAAMTDQGGPGCHILYQDFVVPAAVTSAILTFDRFRGNRGGPFTLPKPLDHTVPTNQLARVDITTSAASPFSILPADVLLNVFMTKPGDPNLDPGYITQTVDITTFLAPFAGQTLRLRIGEVDNTGLFQFGIDNVVLDVNGVAPPITPPPPSGDTTDEGNYPGIGGPQGADEGSYGYGFGIPRPASQSPVLWGPFLTTAAGSYSYASLPSGRPADNTGMIVFNVSHTQNTQADGHTAATVGPVWIVAWLIVGLLGVAVAAKTSF